MNYGNGYGPTPAAGGAPAATKPSPDTEKKDFTKGDAEKLPHHLLPFGALADVSAVLAFGAKRYAAHNWRRVDLRSRYASAALRHLFAYSRGEDRDPESGLRHLAHAACCVLFLLEADIDGLGTDDRVAIPSPQPPPKP